MVAGALEQLIEECVRAANSDNEDFALTRWNAERWEAQLGNTCSLAHICEAGSVYSGHGNTAQSAVIALLSDIKAHSPKER